MVENCELKITEQINNIYYQDDDREPSEVPVHRTINKEQPLVFPSSIETADRAVEPLEDIHSHGTFPYGPRALQVIKSHSKSCLSTN